MNDLLLVSYFITVGLLIALVAGIAIARLTRCRCECHSAGYTTCGKCRDEHV